VLATFFQIIAFLRLHRLLQVREGIAFLLKHKTLSAFQTLTGFFILKEYRVNPWDLLISETLTHRKFIVMK